MAQPKLGTSTTGTLMHYSAGAIIRRDDKILLIERAIEPFGFAGPAGHVDEGEDSLTAMIREGMEETGLHLTRLNLIDAEELDWNWCSKGASVHQWYLYDGFAFGDLRRNLRETMSADWYTREQIKGLELEPVWRYWFEKLRIID